MRLLELAQTSQITMRDLASALGQKFDLERVGGDTRVYQVGDRFGVIFLLNNSLRGLGLIWSRGNSFVQSVCVWNHIDFDMAPDMMVDLPQDATLDQVIEPLLKFIMQPRIGVVESFVLEDEPRRFDPTAFSKPENAEVGLPDRAIDAARNAVRDNPSESIVLMGRKADGSIFQIPGVEEMNAKLTQMLQHHAKKEAGSGSTMEEQYKLLDQKVELVAGGRSQFVKSLLVTGMPSAGKALALDTLIPTPTGWTTMGEIQVGDHLFDEEGRVCEVTAATPVQNDRPCYRITFSDGSTVVADADHRWAVTSLAARQRIGSKDAPACIMTTAEMAPRLRCGSKWNFRVACAQPLQLEEKNFVIDPYVLGAWLGDGTASGPTITSGKHDLDEMSRFLGQKERITCRETTRSGVWTIRIDPHISGDSKKGNGFKNRLRDLGLLNNKHIPDDYLRGSYQQRLALFQGLMDTDGTVDVKGRCEICLSDEKLIYGVIELMRSLGIAARVRTGKTSRKDRHRVSFTTTQPVFTLSRKASRLLSGQMKSCSYRSIVACDRIQTVSVRCIEVSSQSQLFLCTENFIPTHNTFRVMKKIKELGLHEGDDYISKKGKITPHSLYRVLLEQIDGGLVIFDDCDSVVRYDDAVNMLKGALDTDEVREVSYDVKGLLNTGAMPKDKRDVIQLAMSKILRNRASLDDIRLLDGYRNVKTRAAGEAPAENPVKGKAAAYDASWLDDDSESNSSSGPTEPTQQEMSEAEEWVMNHLPNKIDFRGRLIFISNMSEEEWRGIGDGAIISRAFHQNMYFPDAEMLDYIDTIKQHIKAPNLTENDKKEVLDYVRELWLAGKITKPINFRLVQQAFDLFLMNDWRSLVANIG